MSNFIDRKFNLDLTGEEILFIEFLMQEKLNGSNKQDSRKIYDRLFDKFITIKNKNKFFESKTKHEFSDIKNDQPIIKTNELNKPNNITMNQKREVLSFSDFTSLQENNITPIDDYIKTAAPRKVGDVNWNRKNVNMPIDMAGDILTPKGQNPNPAPNGIQKDDEKDEKEATKKAEDLNKEIQSQPVNEPVEGK